MTQETFGRWVARLRRERQMTQAELAARMHVTDKAVSKWERDAARPDISSLPRLADALGVSASELLAAVDPRGISAPGDGAHAPEEIAPDAKEKLRPAFRCAGKSLLLAAVAVLAALNLYKGYVFDWLMGNTMTFEYPFYVLLILRHVFAACALLAIASLVLERGRARWVLIAAAGFAALSALCTAASAGGWIMLFPERVFWYDWLCAALHTLAAALIIEALPLRRSARRAARAVLCSAGLCVGIGLVIPIICGPNPYFSPADMILTAAGRAVGLGAPMFLLALALPGEAEPGTSALGR